MGSTSYLASSHAYRGDAIRILSGSFEPSEAPIPVAHIGPRWSAKVLYSAQGLEWISMTSVFVSYRWEDNPDAPGQIYARPKGHFGEGSVFFDIARTTRMWRLLSSSSRLFATSAHRNTQPVRAKSERMLNLDPGGWLRCHDYNDRLPGNIRLRLTLPHGVVASLRNL